MKNKHTAVEWLMDQMEQMQYFIGNDLYNAVKEAKQMEREQIMDAHIEGQRVFDKHPHTQWTNDQAEHYYNETFKSE
jgi:hypothetical protein